MMTPFYHGLSPEERRLQAVLALFRGEKASQVSAEFRICRSDLYKFRERALEAMRAALKDHPRGPKRPYNRLSEAREQQVIASCQRNPTQSSYQVQEKLGSDAPSANRAKRSFTSVRSEDDRVGSVQILTYQGFDHRASEASSFLWVELSLVVLMHPGYGRLNSAPEYRRS